MTTAVARGDLSQKTTVDARGEILELKSTINTMVDQLGSSPASPDRATGLAVCRRMVERHSGTIWAESVPGRGTMVCFTVRVAPDPASG